MKILETHPDGAPARVEIAGIAFVRAAPDPALVGLDRLPEVMRDGAAPAQTQDIATMTDTNTDHGGAVAWRYRWVEGARSGAWKYCHDTFPTAEDRFDAECEIEVQPLYTHPAPATADKLKVAKEALERIRNLNEYGSYEREVATQALAALKTGDA